MEGNLGHYYYAKDSPEYIEIADHLKPNAAYETLLHELLHHAAHLNNWRKAYSMALRRIRRTKMKPADAARYLEEVFIECVDGPLYKILNLNWGFGPKGA